MTDSISITEIRKYLPAKTVGRMTVTDKDGKKRVLRITYGDFLKLCPYPTIKHGVCDGPEYVDRVNNKYVGYIEEFYHYDIHDVEYEYHICRKHVKIGNKREKPTYVYPTKITSDYVGGVVYTSNGRQIL